MDNNCCNKAKLVEIILGLHHDGASDLEMLVTLAKELDAMYALVNDLKERVENGIDPNSITHEMICVNAIGTENVEDRSITANKLSDEVKEYIADMSIQKLSEHFKEIIIK